MVKGRVCSRQSNFSSERVSIVVHLVPSYDPRTVHDDGSVPAGDHGYAGSIYNPENGKIYSITMQAKGSNKLEVEGCVLAVLCGSESWSRQREETAFARPASGQD